jgi:AmiR/NasT family two-component response regulator
MPKPLNADLDALTEHLDQLSRPLIPAEMARLHRMAKRVGRDPVIEDAKQVLRRLHNITGATALEAIGRRAQREHRTIEEIAAEVVWRGR